MVDAALLDLAKVDRDVARTFERVRRFREGLARDPEAHEGDDPFFSARYVCGQATYEGLAELSPSKSDTKLRDALRRWVYAFTQGRVNRELDVAWARASNAPVGRFEGEPARRVSYRDAWRGVVRSRSEDEARLWLDATADAGNALSAIARERATRRLEVARRIGRDDALDVGMEVPHAALRRAARALLSKTDAVAQEARAARPAESPAGVMIDAVGRGAPEGFPARLTGQWLEELFREPARGLRVRLSPLPSIVGAASFARALYDFGFALHIAAREPGLPFALARDPQPRVAHQYGFVFAALAADTEFQRVALGNARRVASAQARVLSRTLLLAARVTATRWLLGDVHALGTKSDFEELSLRIFGAPLPASLAGAWPAPREDDSARLLGLLDAAPLMRELVERFDTDWFRNPRAARELHARATMDVADAASATPEALDASTTALARALEEALA